MDITKMTPDEVKRLAVQSVTRVAFSPHDVFAVMAAEAAKLVKAHEAVLAGQPLPPAQLIAAVGNRIRDLGMTLASQTSAAPPPSGGNGIVM